MHPWPRSWLRPFGITRPGDSGKPLRAIAGCSPGRRPLPDALHLLGLVALSQDHSDEAVRLIREAIAALPRFAAAHSSLGNALRALGRSAEAQSSYRQAIALNPQCAPAHHGLGVQLHLRGEAAALRCRRGRPAALRPGSGVGPF